MTSCCARTSSTSASAHPGRRPPGPSSTPFPASASRWPSARRSENQPREDLPLLDEIELATDQDLEDPPPVAVFPVEDAAAIVRALPTEHPIIVAGDGDGLVTATAAGVIDPDRAILYSAGLLQDDDTEMFETALADGADIVVTDSNRRRARRWGAIRENEGYTEMAGEEALEYEVGDARLDVFPAAGDDSFTVAVQRGGATVQASAYGNPVSYTPGDRAFFAVDGDPRTAWKVGAFSEVEGEYLRLTTDEPVTTDHVGLTQPLSSDINRWITEVELRFDGGDPVRVDLTEASRTEPGQVVAFPERTFRELEIEILGDTIGYRPKLAGVSAVGFAEVDLEGIRARGADPPAGRCGRRRRRGADRPPADLCAAAPAHQPGRAGAGRRGARHAPPAGRARRARVRALRRRSHLRPGPRPAGGPHPGPARCRPRRADGALVRAPGGLPRRPGVLSPRR